MLNLLSEIGHHWRQPLSIIRALTSGYEVKKNIGILEEDEDLEHMHKISNEIEKLSQVLEDIQKIDFEKNDIKDLEELISVSSNPIFKN
jgi:signal transduction histidine kinase